MILLRIASRNVFRYWRRSLSSLLAVATGCVALILFQGFVRGVTAIYRATFAQRGMFGDVIVERAGAQENRIAEFAEKTIDVPGQRWVDGFLANAPEVENRVRFLDLAGTITNGRNSTIFAGYGYDVPEGTKIRGDWAWNTLAGSPLAGGDEEAIVVGRRLGSTLQCEAEPVASSYITPQATYRPERRPFHCLTDTLQLSVTTVRGSANAISTSVAGFVDAIVAEVDLRFLALPLGQAQDLLDTRAISRYSVKLKDATSIDGFLRRFRQAATVAGIPVVASRWEDHRLGRGYVEIMQWLTVAEGFLFAVILGMTGLAVLNTVLKMVQERTREVGTLRSIGFRGRHIVGLFTLEAGMLGLLGSMVGAVLAFVIAKGVGFAGVSYDLGNLSSPIPLHVGFGWGILGRTCLLFCVIAALSALLPSLGTMKKAISECFGHH